MSQLRKSASFRSRIPVRARIAQRRCSSPQPISSKKSRQNKKNSKFFFDRYYSSSSSFSSSDESHDSQEPLQVILLIPFDNDRNQFSFDQTLNFHSRPSSRRDAQSRQKRVSKATCGVSWSEHKLISFVMIVCLLTATTCKQAKKVIEHKQQHFRRFHKTKIIFTFYDFFFFAVVIKAVSNSSRNLISV